MTCWADWLRRVPGLIPLVRGARRALGPPGALRFPGSAAYWRQRYAEGGHSGPGSYGKFALFKAEVLNGLFDELALGSAIEFGCGDGNQLRLLSIADYLGVDISPEAVARCRAAFAGVPGRRFVLLAAGDGMPDAHGPDTYRGERADCALSLDVIYHLVEDAAFEAHLRLLFAAATRCVVIYSSDRDADAADGPHVRHRRFTEWVAAQAPQWRLLRHMPNAHPFAGDWRTGSFADFYVYVPRVGA